MDRVSFIQIGLLYFVVYILLMNYVANFFDKVAEEKGYKDLYTICLLLPIVGWILVCALPDRKGERIDIDKCVLSDKLNVVKK